MFNNYWKEFVHPGQPGVLLAGSDSGHIREKPKIDFTGETNGHNDRRRRSCMLKL